MNTKRLGRYHYDSAKDNSCNNNSHIDSESQSYFNKLASVHRKKSPYLDWDIPLFENKRTSLQKLLANANKTTERASNFINKIRSRQLACANRAKSIPENATIRKEYIKCRKEVCQHKHGPYYYAYWKDPESKSRLSIISNRLFINQ